MKTKMIYFVLMATSLTTFMSCQKYEEVSPEEENLDYYDKTGDDGDNDGHIPIAFWTDQIVSNDMKLYVNGHFVDYLQKANHGNRQFVTCSDTNLIWCYLPGDYYTIKVANDEGNVFLEAKVGFSSYRASIGIVSISKGDLFIPFDVSNDQGKLGSCGRFNEINLLW